MFDTMRDRSPLLFELFPISALPMPKMKRKSAIAGMRNAMKMSLMPPFPSNRNPMSSSFDRSSKMDEEESSRLDDASPPEVPSSYASML